MLLDVADRRRSAAVFADRQAMDIVERDFVWSQFLATSSDPIYGLNTLFGNLDDHKIAGFGSAVQYELLKSHLISPSAPQAAFSARQIRCILAAKISSVCLGGTGVSPELLQHLIDTADDPAFIPVVPAGQSYSSGDVIPAAHLADQILQHRGYLTSSGLRPGETMALINGAFVHVGVAASLLAEFDLALALLQRAMQGLAALSGGHRQVFLYRQVDLFPESDPRYALFCEGIQPLHPDIPATVTSPQASVSIRAIPEVIAALLRGGDRLFGEIERQLGQRSGNPLFLAAENLVLSQASFLAPELALSESAMIDTSVLAATVLVHGLQHVLSGRVPGIPVDANTPGFPLGFIQVPKELMANLERLRRTCGARPFQSIGATSLGIEDIWTNGLSTSLALADVLRAVCGMALRVCAVCEVLAAEFFDAPLLLDEPARITVNPVGELPAMEARIWRTLPHSLLENSECEGLVAQG